MSKKLPVAITQEEFGMLVKNTKFKKYKIAFLLGFGAGMRISEIVKLTPEKINMRDKSIFISQGKGSKDRVVPLPKGFKESHKKFFPIDVGIRSLELAFKKSCEKAGLLKSKPDLHFHSLRHGFASHAIKKGMPIHYLRTLLGHSNIATTNVYLELNPKEALKSYSDLF